MGQTLVVLLNLFKARVPDLESYRYVLELASTSDRWSAGHQAFSEVRRRFLAATKAQDRFQCAQYSFEESCLQAMYNATDPKDPFDPGSAFFVAGTAIALARAANIPVESVAAVLAPL